MKRNYGILLSCLLCLLCVSLAIPALASETFAQRRGRVVDDAGLLTDEQARELKARLDGIVAEYACDVVVATTPSTDGETPRAYAEDFFDSRGYGIGEDGAGVILLISMEERDWIIFANETGKTVFTEWGDQYIGEQILPALRDGEYYQAFDRFASLADQFLAQAQSGDPYDEDNEPPSPERLVTAAAIALALGLCIALAVVLIMKSKLKTVRPQHLAHEYIRSGSFHVTRGHEHFLYASVVQTERPTHNDNNSSGSSYSGSSGNDSHAGGKF
ncbi:hypothetical protein FACS1894196_1940 [Clostridia bacterium]|nr:hypothetical protein FACS1894196_1940 [Clostridia bacterium]